VKRVKRLALLAVAFTLVACPAPTPPLGPPPAGTPGARWVLHPQQPLEPAASVRLDGGATLYVGPDGTRWLRDGGSARAADEVLDAKLVGVVALAGGSVALTGDDGTTYVAPSPLAPVTEVRRARARSPSVGAGRAAIVGAPRGLRLVTSAPTKLAGAAAVHTGRAAIGNGRWLEIARDGDRWFLHAAELGGAVEARPFAVLDGCAQAWLSVDGNTTWLACAPAADATVVRLFASDDGGAHVRGGPTLRKAAADEVRLFAWPRGGLLVQGACLADDPAPCTESSRVLLGPAGVRAVGIDASMRLSVVRGAPDGSLYALATAGTGMLYLLASRDDGASFSSLALPLLDACGCSPTGEGALGVGDGEIAVVAYANADRWLRYASVDHGAHVTATLLSIAPDAVDLAGRRGLAYGMAGGWETADLGATWAPVPVPWSLEVEASKKTQVACSAEGCLIDADATRLGWALPVSPQRR
jgi:hypothetical protein